MNPEQNAQPVNAQEALDIQKEIFMTSGGLKVGQSMAEYRAEREEIWRRMHPETVSEPAVAAETVTKPKESPEQEKQAAEEIRARDADKLKEVRRELGLTEETDKIGNREKLFGWSASYELAKVAQQEGVDLVALSREEYADYAIKNLLAIDDDQLRMSPWQRTCTSPQEIIKKKNEIRKSLDESDKLFHRFAMEVKTKAGEANRFLSDKIKVRAGTKDSQSWLFFGINDSIDTKRPETYKSYASVKDLSALTPDRFILFMKALRDAGYNGDVKIFQDLNSQGVSLNDQMVMHGRTERDSKLALVVAEKFWGNDLGQKGEGKDEAIDGVDKSYSQILADKIKKAIKEKGKVVA